MESKSNSFVQRLRRISLLALLGLILSVGVKAQLPTAQQIAGKISNGWNLGNTLEVTWWYPGSTTQSAINSVKAAGFDTVRLPVAWFHHSDTVTSVIDPNWLASVKTVVDYCINADMYVIINAHWDHGWLENRVNEANKIQVNQRQHAYWTQIANYFKDYDEHLLFAGANEPNAHDAAATAILMTYHQTFIDAVRATGGNNSSRTLVVQGPSTDIDLTNKYMNSLPVDQIEDRLMVEVHYYTPWNFCGLNGDASWGKMFFYWGKDNHSTTDAYRNATWGEEADMEKYLNMMKTKFIDKGIPVIIGEYGAFRKDLSKYSSTSDQALHNKSIEYFYRYFAKSAISKGIIPYCWDTGGVFNFTTGKINDAVVLNAIMQGASEVVTSAAQMRDYGIKLFPNPFNSEISINIGHPNEVERISIYDISGRIIETFNKPIISSSFAFGASYQPGVYLVNIEGLYGVNALKIIKSKN